MDKNENISDGFINDDIKKQISTLVSEELLDTMDKFGIKDSAGFKNIIAIKDYTTATRNMFRELQKENELYKNQVRQQGIALELLKTQIQQLQIKLYQNNSTQQN